MDLIHSRLSWYGNNGREGRLVPPAHQEQPHGEIERLGLDVGLCRKDSINSKLGGLYYVHLQSIWRWAMRVIPDFHMSFANIGSRAAHTGGSIASGVAYFLFALMFLTMIAEIFLLALRAVN